MEEGEGGGIEEKGGRERGEGERLRGEGGRQGKRMKCVYLYYFILFFFQLRKTGFFCFIDFFLLSDRVAVS